MRDDAPAHGGVSLVIVGDPGNPNVAAVRRVVAALPPDGQFSVDLPPGNYTVTATADGYRAPAPVLRSIEIDASTEFEATLLRRVYRMEAPALAGEAAPIRFERDDDLRFALVWLDAPMPPPGAELAPLLGPGQDEWIVALPHDGPHVIRAVLANAAAADDDPGNDLLATVTAEMTAVITSDTAPPEILSVRVGGGSGYVTEATAVLTVECIDGVAAAGDLRLRVEDAAGEAYDGVYRPVLDLSVVGDEGPRAMTVVCTDAAGHDSVPEVAQFTFDRTPPAVARFVLEGGAENARVDRRAVTVEVETNDDISPVEAVAVSDRDFDCAHAAYVYPAAGTFVYELTPGEGPRRLYLCARDRAGNITPAAIESENAVHVDTIAPAAPGLELADGADWVQRSTVDAQWSTIEDDMTGYTLYIAGDLAGPPIAVPWHERPAQLSLAPGRGLRRVEARVDDAVGNPSTATVVVVRVDRDSPVTTTMTSPTSGSSGASPRSTATLGMPSTSRPPSPTMRLSRPGAEAACSSP